MTTASSLLVHCWLGHPSLSNLKKMIPSLSRVSSLECESCQLGKHSHSSLPSRVNNCVSSPFSIVHSDVWGHSHVSSKQGFHYFVIFMDDFSRTTSFYLMKSRSELFSISTTFCAEIICLFVFFEVIMPLNICQHHSNHIWHQEGVFIKLSVLTPHNKMGLLNAKTII